MKRVFCEEEIASILSSENKAQQLWMFWSAKEAAFKACQKRNVDLVFSPKEFRAILCGNDKTAQTQEHPVGILYHSEHRLDLRWAWLDVNVVHCIAVLSANNNIFTHWDKIRLLIKKTETPSLTQVQQSKLLREAFITFLENEIKINVRIDRPEILVNGQRKKGPPILVQGDRMLEKADISLSHDQAWLAGIYLEGGFQV